MSGRVGVMFAAGLLAMFAFWWFGYQNEQSNLKEDAAITRCAATVPTTERSACPPRHPICWSGDRTPEGVCTSQCSFASSCPKNWCCHPQDDGTRVCTPAVSCAPGTPRGK